MYFDGLITLDHELEGAPVKPILIVHVLRGVRIDAHESIYYFLYLGTRQFQLIELPVYVVDHLHVELLVIRVLL